MDEDDGTSTLADPPVRPSRPSAARLTGDRYRITKGIGRGGMGEVLEARDEQFGRDVAIKRMRAETPSDAQIERFLREAKIQGQLEHPAIVPVHELGRDTDGLPYFAMKKLAGTTLADILDAGEVPRQRLLRAFGDVCLAIELAHTRGIVHRDLKPANLMLGDFGETYVLDWGVAKIVGETDEGIAALDSGEHETKVGVAIGTPGYMAPEQARGDLDIDARADIYSLGCVLFEILAGQRLHPRGIGGLSPGIEGIDARPSVRAPKRDIPPELDALCVRATAVDRKDRVPSARELGEGVQRYLDGDRDLALRRSLATEHLDLALTAFAAEDRGTAMREAGRALALDPMLNRAGELITRLMLEPPRVVPPEVVAELDRDSQSIARRNAGGGAFSYIGYLLLLPIWFVTGSASPLFCLAFGGVCLTSMGFLWRLSRPGSVFVIWPAMLLNALSIVMVGMVCTPFLLGIAIAAATAVGFVGGRFMTTAGSIGMATFLSGAVLVPWLVERIGWLPISTTVGNGVLELHAPMFSNPAVVAAVLVLATLVIVFAATLLTRNIVVSERMTRQRLYLQTWQLRHLVTDAG